MQLNFDLWFIRLEFVPDVKRSGFSKAYGPYNGVGTVFLFVVAMPGYAVLTSPVKIEQNARKYNA